MKTIWIAALAACFMSAASAQTAVEPRVVAAAEFCSKMPTPKWPALGAAATYQVLTVVRDGRIASVEIRTLKAGGLTRKDERAVKNEIVQAVQKYECKADGLYSFEQTMELPAN